MLCNSKGRLCCGKQVRPKRPASNRNISQPRLELVTSPSRQIALAQIHRNPIWSFLWAEPALPEPVPQPCFALHSKGYSSWLLPESTAVLAQSTGTWVCYCKIFCIYKGFKCMLDIQTVVWTFFEEWPVLFRVHATENSTVTASQARKCGINNGEKKSSKSVYFPGTFQYQL